MIERSRYWFQILLVGVIAITALPRGAAAQTTTGVSLTMSPQQPVKREPSRNNPGTDQTFALTITRDDCRSTNVKYTYSLSITGYDPSMFLYAYAGPSNADCKAQIGSTSFTRTCWSLGKVEINVTGSTPTAKVTYTPKQLFGIGATEGLPILKTCEDKSDFFKTPQTFNLQFLLIQNGNVVVANVSQPVYFVLDGPAPPPNVTPEVADSCLKLRWGAIGSVSGDVSYQFYCAPNEATQEELKADTTACHSAVLDAAAVTSSGGSSSTGTGGTSSVGTAAQALEGDLGVAGDTSVSNAGSSSVSEGGSAGVSNAGSSSVSSTGGGGTAGASSTMTTAGSSATGGAADPATTATAGTTSTRTDTLPDLTKYKCGSVQGKANLEGYTSQTLTNEKSYAVSVAVVDRFGNVGPLSTPKCATPTLVETFFDGYRADGGKAGGGFCSIDLRRGSAALPIAGLSLLAIGFMRRRARAQRKDRQNSGRTHH